jgi:hypothetical protein
MAEPSSSSGGSGLPGVLKGVGDSSDEGGVDCGGSSKGIGDISPCASKVSRRKWTGREDDLLRESVGVHGEGHWKAVANSGVPGRNGEQCRIRWRCSVCPRVDESAWSQEEDDILRRGRLHENNWSHIGRSHPTRSLGAMQSRWAELVRLDGGPGCDPVSISRALAPARPWTSAEDNLLRASVAAHGSGRNLWSRVAEDVPGRSRKDCRHRWFRLVQRKPAGDDVSAESTAGTPQIRARWTRDEDSRLVQAVGLYGTSHWANVSELVPGRPGNSCRSRWAHHIGPSLIGANWSDSEDAVLVAEHKARCDRFDLIRESLRDRNVDEAKSPKILVGGQAYDRDVILARWDSIVRGSIGGARESGSSSARTVGETS